MGYQDSEIQRSHKSLPRKPCRAVMVMIGEIRNQEERRRYYCCHLAIAMGLNSTVANKSKARQQKKRAR